MPEKIEIHNPFDELPNFNCFACSPAHSHGLRLRFFAVGDEVRSEFTARDDLTSFLNILHGGIQSTLLDEVMWWAVFYFKKRICLSEGIKIDFRNVVKLGQKIRATGRVLREEKNRVFTEGSLVVGDRVLVSAEGSYFLPNARLLARSMGMNSNEIPLSLKQFL